MSPKLEQLIRELGPEGPRSLGHLEQALQNIRFTGSILTHWAGGNLKQVDLGPPIRLTIVDSQPRELQRGVLDNERSVRTG